MPRLLFSSYQCYCDPSNGAALCTRELLELLAQRGWSCRVLCGPRLDFEQGTRIAEFLQSQHIAFGQRQSTAGAVPFSVFHFRSGGVGVHIYESRAVPPFQPASRAEGVCFLALYEQVLERYRPELVLTYGGDWVAEQIIAQAKRRSIPVVFALHNFAYHGADLFRPVDAVLVPSRFAQAHYRRTLGLTCTSIPGPWDWNRVRCKEYEPKYVTVVNPAARQRRLRLRPRRRRAGSASGLTCRCWWSRAAARRIGCSRPGSTSSRLGNTFVMANTPDPRDFYTVSKIVLMPSLWWESFPRVAVESLINGIPVLGSIRGGLPETLQEAGFVFDIPERYTPQTRLLPTAEEVAPWVDTIIRLWDEEEFYQQERRRCLAAAEAWRPERLLPRFEEFFGRVLRPAWVC